MIALLEPDAIEALFKRAADTLRIVPMTARDAPAQLRCAWPEVVRSREDRFVAEVGADEQLIREMRAGRLRVRTTPTKDDLSNLDRCLEWLWLIGPSQRRLIMARACGRSLRKLAPEYHASYEHVRKLHRLALIQLAAAVNNAHGKKTAIAP